MRVTTATPDHRDSLYALYLAMLARLDQYGFEVLPTERNAAHFVDSVFLPAAERGDPVLLAFEGEEAVGALFWVCDHGGQIDTRHKVCHGYGVQVNLPAPAKAEELLMRVGVEMIREQGFEIVLAGVQNGDGSLAKPFKKLGFRPFAVCDKLTVEDVPAFEG